MITSPLLLAGIVFAVLIVLMMIKVPISFVLAISTLVGVILAPWDSTHGCSSTDVRCNGFIHAHCYSIVHAYRPYHGYRWCDERSH